MAHCWRTGRRQSDSETALISCAEFLAKVQKLKWNPRETNSKDSGLTLAFRAACRRTAPTGRRRLACWEYESILQFHRPDVRAELNVFPPSWKMRIAACQCDCWLWPAVNDTAPDMTVVSSSLNQDISGSNDTSQSVGSRKLIKMFLCHSASGRLGE